MPSLALLFLTLVAFPVLARALPVDELIRQGTEAEHRFDSRAALALFLQADATRPNDAFILQKISRQYSDSMLDLPADDLAGKRRLAEAGLSYAQRSVALAPDNAINVLSLAICHGKLALYSDTREKIRYSRLVKEEAERALALAPDYDWAHHVLGRWNREVASLGPASRFFLRAIYGGLPEASYAQAIVHLERAAVLAPQVAPHQIELGFAYLAAGRPADARAALERGLALPVSGKHDDETKARAREALQKLGR